jgi:hypothetical protein
VACPGDELPSRVEQPLEARRHLVRRAGDGGDLARSTRVGAGGELTGGEASRRSLERLEPSDERQREQQAGDHCCER